jgi:hypothetical protein
MALTLVGLPSLLVELRPSLLDSEPVSLFAPIVLAALTVGYNRETRFW